MRSKFFLTVLRRNMRAAVVAGTASLSFAWTTHALADVTISSDATQNMSCSNGVCAPTASDAVLNVNDLETLLASGSVTVTTTGSGVQANNIGVAANLGWSTNALTLDAYKSISANAPITVRNGSGLSILTNDGGSGGELAFFGKGRATFKKVSSSLSINGTSYTLIKTIALLASAIQKNPGGAYALASYYDARIDGTYTHSPITADFTGSFEGLGNTIANLTIDDPADTLVGLFAQIGSDGRVSDVYLQNANVTLESANKRAGALVGTLAGEVDGSVTRSRASGSVVGPRNGVVGGLVGGIILGSLSMSSAYVSIVTPTQGGGLAGGLMAEQSRCRSRPDDFKAQ